MPNPRPKPRPPSDVPDRCHQITKAHVWVESAHPHATKRIESTPIIVRPIKWIRIVWPIVIVVIALGRRLLTDLTRFDTLRGVHLSLDCFLWNGLITTRDTTLGCGWIFCLGTIFWRVGFVPIGDPTVSTIGGRFWRVMIRRTATVTPIAQGSGWTDATAK